MGFYMQFYAQILENLELQTNPSNSNEKNMKFQISKPKCYIFGVEESDFEGPGAPKTKNIETFKIGDK